MTCTGRMEVKTEVPHLQVNRPRKRCKTLLVDSNNVLTKMMLSCLMSSNMLVVKNSFNVENTVTLKKNITLEMHLCSFKYAWNTIHPLIHQ